MSASENNGLFLCDCGFSWQRGQNGTHSCGDGLRQQIKALAAENAGLIRSSEALLHEASEVYRAYNKTQLPDGDLVDEESLQDVYDAINATPATDAFLAEVRAQGVEMFALMFAEEAIKSNNITNGWRARASRAASDYADQLRQGAAL